MRHGWTDDDLAAVLNWRAEGYSMGEIAKAFGSTKSAVAGLMMRLRNEDAEMNADQDAAGRDVRGFPA